MNILNQKKLKSYILLMMYNLDNIVGKSIKNMQSMFPDDTEIKDLEKEFSKSARTLLVNFDIDDWDTEMDEILRSLITLFNGLVRIGIIEGISLELLFRKWGLDDLMKTENKGQDFETFINRVVFLLNKYYYIKEIYLKIIDNYLDFQKHYSDIKLGTKRFDMIVLKKNNKGGSPLSSSRTYMDIESYFHNIEKKRLPTLNYILRYPPVTFLDKIRSRNATKIDVFFKREFVREAFYYMNYLELSISSKEYLLGYFFVLMHWSLDIDSYMTKKIRKDKFSSSEISEEYKKDLEKEYEHYLRTEGHNIRKTL
jgi:hypothetical protein